MIYLLTIFDHHSTRYIIITTFQVMQVAGRGRTKVLVPKDANIPPEKMQAILDGTGDGLIMKGNKMYKPMFR